MHPLTPRDVLVLTGPVLRPDLDLVGDDDAPLGRDQIRPAALGAPLDAPQLDVVVVDDPLLALRKGQRARAHVVKVGAAVARRGPALGVGVGAAGPAAAHGAARARFEIAVARSPADGAHVVSAGSVFGRLVLLFGRAQGRGEVRAQDLSDQREDHGQVGRHDGGEGLARAPLAC